VRDAGWQQAFLARPLEERKAVGQSVRQQSQERKEAGMQAVDIDREAALAWLEAADAQVLLHGHTHRPGEEVLAASHRRIVLSDWDATAVPPRAEVLRIDALGVQRLPLAP
jgi:UDP-2,3-diacylglucosamine hydrolase